MMTLRATSSLLSVMAHVGFVAFLVVPQGGAALEEGTGSDLLVIEQGIAVEGIAKLGEGLTTAEAVEAEPVAVSEARPEVQEVVARELPEETTVIESTAGPEQQVLEEEPLPDVKPQERQVATIEQQQPVVVEEQQSSGAAKRGGKTSILSAYKGKLHSHLAGKAVAARGRLTGIVTMRFKVDNDGKLLSREVAASSGFKVLDETAIAWIERAAPFPPRPDGVETDVLEFTIPMKFSIR